MSKRSPPWFWDTVLLEWTAWVLLAAAVATYAGQAVAALLAGRTQWIFGL